MNASCFDTKEDEIPCFCYPHPDLVARSKSELSRQTPSIASILPPPFAQRQTIRGLNDDTLYPKISSWKRIKAPSKSQPRNGALTRAPLQGVVKCVLVLVDFPDQTMAAGTANHFRDLFFSTGKLPNGSVTEYYKDVSSGKIKLAGDILGPYRMPKNKSYYASGNYGTNSTSPNVKDLAADALSASKTAVDFDPYDNDGNGQVDAFIVVHAGQGGEASGNKNDFWSVKWNLPKSTTVNHVNVYSFLTIPEDAQIGVCSHELGHLLFGWPDLYDVDGSSQGIGNWCLMATGVWGGTPAGSKPCHPSAWCKLNQGWATQHTVVTNGSLAVEDVKTSKVVHRLWTNGDTASKEYFLLENREQVGFDTSLPAHGLLVWHIDDAKISNADERHYKVGLMQADGLNQTGTGATNRGDSGDAFPGRARNTTFNSTSNPNSKSYAGGNTSVSVTKISDPGPKMTMSVTVKP